MPERKWLQREAATCMHVVKLEAHNWLKFSALSFNAHDETVSFCEKITIRLGFSPLMRLRTVHH